MIYLFVIFCLLQALDIYTTYTTLHADLGHEANPIMAWLFQDVGLGTGLLVAKIAICATIYWFIDQTWLMVLLDIAYLEIVVNNFRVLKSAK
jgi:hypothetical protein